MKSLKRLPAQWPIEGHLPKYSMGYDTDVLLEKKLQNILSAKEAVVLNKILMEYYKDNSDIIMIKGKPIYPAGTKIDSPLWSSLKLGDDINEM